MTTRRVRDLCGLYCVAEFADYQRAEFFMYLISTASPAHDRVDAHDRQTGALMFDMQVEAGAPALEAHARKAGTNTDAQAVAAAFKPARRIVDADDYRPGTRFQLQVEEATESLQRIGTG